MNDNTSYVYKITFEEVPHFYFGVRKGNPEGDPYLGSPKTHKNYWKVYTPKKQVFAIFASWEEACRIEKELIRQNWDSRYCLNDNYGGFLSLEALSKGNQSFVERNLNPIFRRLRADKISKALIRRYKEDPDYRKSHLEKAKAGGKALSEKIKSDEDFANEISHLRSMASKVSPRNTNQLAVTNGREVKYIHRSEEVPIGWKLGRPPSKWIYQGNQTAKIHPDDPLPEGWSYGRKPKNNGPTFSSKTNQQDGEA